MRRLSAQESTKKFHEVVWPLMPTILRVGRILTGNQAEAEDLAQETMLKAFRGIESFAQGTNAKAWLLTILRHCRIDHLRAAEARPGRTVSLESLEMDPADGAHDASCDRDALWKRPEEALNDFSDQQIIGALQALPEEIRLTLLLVDVEGLDQADAGEILQVPVGTIKSRAHRGRAMLRQALLPLARERRMIR